MNLRPGERVLLVGCGTGADLPLLQDGVEAVGVDISLDMLARARPRLPLPGRAVSAISLTQAQPGDVGGAGAVAAALVSG